MDWKEFLQDQDAALRSLDKTTILSYYRKYGEAKIARRMEAATDTDFWASVHRARLTLASFTEPEKVVSAT